MARATRGLLESRVNALTRFLARIFGSRAPGASPRTWSDAALGLFLVLAAAILVGLIALLGGIHWGRELEVTARFTDATGLSSGAPVLVAGVVVGRVTGLSVQDGMAVVTLAVSPDADLRENMTAAIRSKTLLGERVIQLLPGPPGAAPLKSGDVIARTLPSTEPDALMSGLVPFLSEVDPADVGAVAHAIGQAARKGDIAHALAAMVRLDSLLEAEEPKIDGLLEELNRTAPVAGHLVGALDAEMPTVHRTLTDADGAMAGAPELMGRADRMFAHTDRLATTLDDALATSSPHLVAQTQLVLDRLPATLDRLDRLADKLSVLTDRLGPAVDKASGLLNEPTVHKLLRKDGIRVHLF